MDAWHALFKALSVSLACRQAVGLLGAPRVSDINCHLMAPRSADASACILALQRRRPSASFLLRSTDSRSSIRYALKSADQPMSSNEWCFIRHKMAIKLIRQTEKHAMCNYNYNYIHLCSPQQTVAITTYLQYKQKEKKRKKTKTHITKTHEIGLQSFS